jgi:drug/metabolite transporter (DMT)-like permease
MLWIVLAAVAAPLQVARNAMQRGLVGDAGPWGATLVRFLFGLPFALAIFAVTALLTREAQPDASGRFWAAAVIGSIAQVGGTGFLLMAMGRSGFAVATVLQQSALPLAALLGWGLLGDDLAAHAWWGIALATAGLAVLSWPRRDQAQPGFRGGLLGLAAGVSFAVAFNGFRQASLALDPLHPIYSATAALVVAQLMQAAGLTALLALRRPGALRAVISSWRSSLAAGLFGSAASACWFGALALSPAGPVRAVGLIETPVAAAVGHRLFRERPSARQWLGGALTTFGVLMTTLG